MELAQTAEMAAKIPSTAKWFHQCNKLKKGSRGQHHYKGLMIRLTITVATSMHLLNVGLKMPHANFA